MPLRIVVDARRVSDFGIGTYIRNLVYSLAKIDTSNFYTLITSAPAVPEFAGLPSNFSTTPFTRKSKSGWPIGLQRVSAPHRRRSVSHPLERRPAVDAQTIHGHHSRHEHAPVSNEPGYQNSLRRFYLRRGLLHADRVIAVSSATRHDVVSLLDIPASRIRVVYNPPDPIFRPLPGASGAAYPPEIRLVLSVTASISVPSLCRANWYPKEHPAPGGGFRRTARRNSRTGAVSRFAPHHHRR